jgi:UDP-N-acetylmuramate--alanine ligase
VYPAREQPIEGVTTELISKRMKNRNVRILDKKEVLKDLKNRKMQGRLIITAGAGDIDTLVEPIKQLLTASA